jgi:hypothetical protein
MEKYVITFNGKDIELADSKFCSKVNFITALSEKEYPSALARYVFDIAWTYMQFMKTHKCSVAVNPGNLETIVGKCGKEFNGFPKCD